MSTALFVSLNELKKNTNISGNIDPNHLLPSIKVAQELEIEPVIGTDLYDKISNDIIAGTLSGVYLNLKQNYIHDILINMALVYYLPFATYQMTNGGISHWNGGENFESVGSDEITFLINKQRNIAESYKKRLIDHLCNNSSLYPEYKTNTGEDINPSNNTNRSGLYLN